MVFDMLFKYPWRITKMLPNLAASFESKTPMGYTFFNSAPFFLANFSITETKKTDTIK
jgi:hypothetical protein